jgi:hypothetical protein
MSGFEGMGYVGEPSPQASLVEVAEAEVAVEDRAYA